MGLIIIYLFYLIFITIDPISFSINYFLSSQTNLSSLHGTWQRRYHQTKRIPPYLHFRTTKWQATYQSSKWKHIILWIFLTKYFFHIWQNKESYNLQELWTCLSQQLINGNHHRRNSWLPIEKSRFTYFELLERHHSKTHSKGLKRSRKKYLTWVNHQRYAKLNLFDQRNTRTVKICSTFKKYQFSIKIIISQSLIRFTKQRSKIVIGKNSTGNSLIERICR